MKSQTKLIIYHNGYVTVKDLSYVIISSVNPLYLIINKIYGYIEESNGNEHLSLVLTDSSFYRRKQRHAKKYEELWNNIRDLIRSISNNSFRSFTSIDHLTLKKTLELFNMIIVVRSLFHFWYMSKDEAINVMKNFDLKEKKWDVIKS